MAWLEKDPSGNYHVKFRFSGQRYTRSLKTKKVREAQGRLQRLEENIRLIESGRLEISDTADIADFLLSDGKFQSGKTSQITKVTLATLFEEFFNSIPVGNLEQTTLDGMQIHKGHLLRFFKSDFDVTKMTLSDLQRYVNKRAKEHTQFRVDHGSNGKRAKRTLVTAATIKKELVTLGTAWRWATTVPLVPGQFPRKGLRFPKTTDKPPFQTWDEIHRQVEQNDLTAHEAALLWDALYLRREEIDELLKHVESAAYYPFIYPMFVMATHTGVRRSEILRSRKVDFDFDTDVVTIRERKRVRGHLTTRRVPISTKLRTTMIDWFENKHPGSALTFCHSQSIIRSRTKALPQQPITRDQAHYHFQRTVAQSKWDKIRGWHCFRHSFISNMACKGIDQRIIDEFVGHTTEQMRRRYRHLFPDVKRNAILEVFG